MIKKLTIHLNGKLKKLCGDNDTVTVGANTPRMAFRALESRFGVDVTNYVRQGRWQLYSGSQSEEDNLTEHDIDSPLQDDDFHVFEYIEGAGGRTGQIILGAALIVAGVFVTGMSFGLAAPIGSALISAGVGMVLQAFFTPSQANMRERPEERASFLMQGGITNTSEQGQPVPLLFGRFRTGSVVVSAGLDVEELMNYWIPPTDAPGGGGGPPIDPDMPNPIIVN